MLFLPLWRIQNNRKSKPCGRRFFHHLRDLPWDRHLVKHEIRSHFCGISSERRTRGSAALVCRLSHQQQLQPREHRLRRLPPQGLSGRYKSKSRVGAILTILPAMPQHHRMVECFFQPQLHSLSSYRPAHCAAPAVYRLSHKQ